MRSPPRINALMRRVSGVSAGSSPLLEPVDSPESFSPLTLQEVSKSMFSSRLSPLLRPVIDTSNSSPHKSVLSPERFGIIEAPFPTGVENIPSPLQMIIKNDAQESSPTSTPKDIGSSSCRSPLGVLTPTHGSLRRGGSFIYEAYHLQPRETSIDPPVEKTSDECSLAHVSTGISSAQEVIQESPRSERHTALRPDPTDTTLSLFLTLP